MMMMMTMLLGLPAVAAGQAGADADSRQGILLAQREAKRQALTPERISRGEERMRGLETWRLPRAVFVKGFHGLRQRRPVLGGMPGGSGFVYGGGYVYGLDRTAVEFSTNVRASTLGYKQADAQFSFPTSRSDSPIRARVRAEYRDFTELNFFGLGTSSNVDDRAFYRIEDRTVTADVALDTRFFDAGATVGLWNGRIASGLRGPSLEARFSAAGTPGFQSQPEFLVYGGHAAVALLDDGFPPVGLTLRIDAERYDDRGTGAFDFTRVVADIQAQIPLGYRSRILAFRFRTSHASADAGAQVPFYLMETVGGAKSIRGFREYRFRDARNVLLNLEYRWEVWTYMDLAIFADAGKVFSDADEFGFDDLHAGYGFGIRTHSPNNTVFRIDLSRSVEGFRLHVGAGPTF